MLRRSRRLVRLHSLISSMSSSRQSSLVAPGAIGTGSARGEGTALRHGTQQQRCPPSRPRRLCCPRRRHNFSHKSLCAIIMGRATRMPMLCAKKRHRGSQYTRSGSFTSSTCLVNPFCFVRGELSRLLYGVRASRGAAGARTRVSSTCEDVMANCNGQHVGLCGDGLVRRAPVAVAVCCSQETRPRPLCSWQHSGLLQRPRLPSSSAPPPATRSALWARAVGLVLHQLVRGESGGGEFS